MYGHSRTALVDSRLMLGRNDDLQAVISKRHKLPFIERQQRLYPRCLRTGHDHRIIDATAGDTPLRCTLYEVSVGNGVQRDCLGLVA